MLKSKEFREQAPAPEQWLLDLFASSDGNVEREKREKAAKAKPPVSKAKVDKICPRCGGTGSLPGYQHVKGGECFKCHGTGRK
jgi:DnaJ-class molecular chaperone